MPTNPSLYGLPRPRSAKPTPNTSSSAFTATLSTLLASPSSSASTTTTGRPRPSKSKTDIFTAHNKGSKKRALADISDDTGLARPQKHAQHSEAVDAATLHRSRRKMEEKARLYASMKRGDYVPPSDGGVNKEENALVDFDRMWADKQDGADRKYDTETDDDGDSEADAEAKAEGDEEMVEYEDEFGRLRTTTKTKLAAHLRAQTAQSHAATELSAMRARPAQPTTLIHGDTIQSAAFNPDAPHTTQMQNLAKKRDRSVTPPEETHYDASKEVRSKGVGFYAFSKDEEGRRRELEALGEERRGTERERREREERREGREGRVEERKRLIKEKKGERLAERFLDGLDGELRGRELDE